MQRIAPAVLFVLAFVLGGLPNAAFADAADEGAKADVPKAGPAKGPDPAIRLGNGRLKPCRRFLLG